MRGDELQLIFGSSVERCVTLGNAPCPCGSGLRFEHCHGQAAPGPAAHGPELDFVVVGTQRGGTSTLGHSLRPYPRVLALEQGAAQRTRDAAVPRGAAGRTRANPRADRRFSRTSAVSAHRPESRQRVGVRGSDAAWREDASRRQVRRPDSRARTSAWLGLRGLAAAARARCRTP
ncbi:MAG: SEC-C metal-binding domain-containing protein [Casimicrobiaceae bacterium]